MPDDDQPTPLRVVVHMYGHTVELRALPISGEIEILIDPGTDHQVRHIAATKDGAEAFAESWCKHSPHRGTLASTSRVRK
jgi:hypothetical protein